MMKSHKIEITLGMILICSGTTEAAPLDWETVDRDENTRENSGVMDYSGPNILDIMIQDGEGATPPTPVNGGYILGIVLQQFIRANWLQSEVGLQVFHDGEKLDPRRYDVEWKIVSSPTAVKARLGTMKSLDYGQTLQIETPMTLMHARVLGSIEIEARITDREQPEKAPMVIVQSLTELLSNGRDGL